MVADLKSTYNLSKIILNIMTQVIGTVYRVYGEP